VRTFLQLCAIIADEKNKGGLLSIMIEAKNISKVYKKDNADIAALKPCSLSLPERGMVVITGRTGSGKSTLLSILAGIEKPTTGELCAEKNCAAYIFQNSMLIDSMTLKENIKFVQRLYPESGVNAEELLNRLELTSRKDNYPTELSGGEKQRAAILIAVLQNKPALFADEPTGNLDEAHAKMIAEFLKEQSASRLTVVVTHDEELFEPPADRKIMLKDGEIVSDEYVDKATSPLKSDSNFTSRPPSFGIRESATAAFALAKKSKTKLISLFIALLLSFLCIISSTNNLFSVEENRVYTALKEQNAVCMDFAKTDKTNDSSNAIKMGEEELDSLKSKYGACFFTGQSRNYFFEKEGKILEDAISIPRTYVSEECPLTILAGKKSLSLNEVAISDYVAEQIIEDYAFYFNTQLSYEDLTGGTFGDLTISAIYSTNYEGSVPSNDELMDSFKLQHTNIYINEETYKSDERLPKWAELNYAYSDASTTGIRTYRDKTEVTDYKLLYGSDENVGEGELLISDYFVNMLGGEAEELIGKKITPPFIGHRGQVLDSSYGIDVNEKEYTIIGVYSCETHLPNIIMNPADYNDAYFKYCVDVTNTESGISVTGCSLSVIKSAYKDGLADASFAEEGITTSTQWMNTLSYILIAVAAALIVIASLFMLSFVNDVLAKNLRTMGVFKALGLTPAQITSVFWVQSTLCILTAFVAVLVLQAFMVILWNKLILSIFLAGAPIVYYGGMSVLLTGGIMLAFLIFMYITIIIKLKTKSSLDLVYER